MPVELGPAGRRCARLAPLRAFIETQLAGLEARITTLTWVVGINIALTTAVLAKLLTLH